MEKDLQQARSDRRFKIVTISSLVVIVILLSIAYLLLAKQLTIKGTTKVNETGWEIEIPKDGENAPTTSSGGDGSVTYEVETRDGVMIIKNLKVILRKPGDFGELTIPIKNSGKSDAYLSYVSGVNGIMTCTGSGINKANDESIVCGDSNNNGASVKYTITFDNDVLTNGTTGIRDLNLKKDITKNVKIRVDYLTTGTEIPMNDVTVLLPEVDFVFQQVM